MNVSDELIDLMKNYETLLLEAKVLEDKEEAGYTIGYGSYRREGVTAGTVITEEQAEIWLR